LVPLFGRIASMHELASWSLNLGRWGGIPVRLHGAFLLFAACVVGVAAEAHPGVAAGGIALTRVSAVALGILLLSVLVHELAHALVATRLGGRVDQLVLGPLGGLSQDVVPHQPRRELVVALAGPMANLAVALALLPMLLLAVGASPMAALNPLAPVAIGGDDSIACIVLKLSVWINGLLALVSFLPAYPFDGGRALRAVLWPVLGYRTAVLVVGRVARVVAVALCLTAYLVRDAYPAGLMPAWLPLLLLAIFVFFSGNQEVTQLDQEESDGDLLELDFSQGYTNLGQRVDPHCQRPHVGVLERWREKRRRVRQQRIEQQQAADDAQVDAILVRLHEHGMDGLDAEERALLERVSVRYRERQRQ
jgi:Zn-dependent protease